MDNRYTIIAIPVGQIKANCYIIGNPETHGCVIIDPGDDAELIEKSLDGYRPQAVLLTHGHFDHVSACDEICEKYSIPAYIHEADAAMLSDSVYNGSVGFGVKPVSLSVKPVTFRGGETLDFSGIPVQTLHTPGHTPGGACYIVDNSSVFCGDTLFNGGYGRTDMAGGDFHLLRESLRKLLFISPRMVAYPGHGSTTYAGR